MFQKWAGIALITANVNIVYATETMPDTYKAPNWQISLAAGAAEYHANDLFLVVSPYETDSAKVRSIKSRAVYRAALGYHLFNELLAERRFFNDVLLELNGYYQEKNTIKGSIWQLNDPEFNNYNFHTPFTNRRLILDLKPTLFTQYNFSVYPLAGIGISRIKASYQEYASQECVPANSAVSLQSRTHHQISYDLGGGLHYAFSRHLGLSLEYIYNPSVKIKPSTVSASPYTVSYATTPAFSTSSQSVLLGITWKL